jgi:hypothetical protein
MRSTQKVYSKQDQARQVKHHHRFPVSVILLCERRIIAVLYQSGCGKFLATQYQNSARNQASGSFQGKISRAVVNWRTQTKLFK